jgi:hypothetical protein
VVTSIVGDGMRMAAVGAIVGVVTVAGAYRVVRSLFVGVQAVEAQPIPLGAGVFTLAMLLATLRPARRAARLNPLGCVEIGIVLARLPSRAGFIPAARDLLPRLGCEEEHVLTLTELRRLARDLANTKVLSIYLGTGHTDPAMRHAWAATLAAGLREARARVSSDQERQDFDRASMLLGEGFGASDRIRSVPGWVAFVTAEARRYMGELPMRPSSLVVWRDGPVVAPYLRALEQQQPVIVALVESRSARIYRYSSRHVEALDTLSAPAEEPAGAERNPAPATSAARIPAARGAVSVDEEQRRRHGVFQRLAASLSERIAQLAGDTNWVLIGGTPEWARRASEALPRNLSDRVLISTTLDHQATTDDIALAAEHAATELRGALGREFIDQLVEDAGAFGRAAADVPAVQRALRARAVDVLLLSPEFIRVHEADAENMVRAAFGAGADVQVPSGSAAERLDQVASGIAARLRFAINERATPTDPGGAAASPAGP